MLKYSVTFDVVVKLVSSSTKRASSLTADLTAGLDVVARKQEKCLYQESNLGIKRP